MTRGSGRPDRVAALIKECLAERLARGIKDPRVGFVTVTRVEVDRDLAVARVHVSVLGEDQDKEQAIEGLESARGFLRHELASAVRLRSVPELRFVLDRGLEHYARINALLDESREETGSS